MHQFCNLYNSNDQTSRRTSGVRDQQKTFRQGMAYIKFGSAMDKIPDTLEGSQNQP
jgi:hypothetical protein